jgi:hypothetical protein
MRNIATAMSPSNRTGAQASPIDAEAQLAVPPRLRDPRWFADSDADEMRGSFVSEADALGSVPVPATAKGMAKAGLQALRGNRAQVLIDKLAERLAFERGGVRLYDQLITKCEALTAAGSTIAMPPLDGLTSIRGDEAAHAQLLVEAIESLGADPTAQTPGADVVGVQSMGLMQVLSDPRTTPTQCLCALLTAELTDNAGWELLSELARDSGQSALAERFAQALQHEAEHLRRIKAWHAEAVLGEHSLMAAAGQMMAGAVGGNGSGLPRPGPAIAQQGAPAQPEGSARSPMRVDGGGAAR